jgi:hypothetical protein
VETEVAYFARKAAEERKRAGLSATSQAKELHMFLAEDLESLGRTIGAKQRRARFYDVNAPSGPLFTNDDELVHVRGEHAA